MRGAGGFYKGTNTEQTPYFGDKEKKLIEKMAWPEIYNQKIDLTKINIDVVGKWIHKRLIEILGFEDDILYEYCVSQLRLDQEGIEDESDNFLNSKRLKINLTGFIGNKKSEIFVQELLELLISNEQNEGKVVVDEMETKRIEMEQVKKENELLQRNIHNLRSLYTENASRKESTPVENASRKTDDPNGRPNDQNREIDGDSPKLSEHIHNKKRKKPSRCSTSESSRSSSQLDKNKNYKRRKNKIYVSRKKRHSDEDTSNGADEEEREEPSSLEDSSSYESREEFKKKKKKNRKHLSSADSSSSEHRSDRRRGKMDLHRERRKRRDRGSSRDRDKSRRRDRSRGRERKRERERSRERERHRHRGRRRERERSRGRDRSRSIRRCRRERRRQSSETPSDSKSNSASSRSIESIHRGHTMRERRGKHERPRNSVSVTKSDGRSSSSPSLSLSSSGTIKNKHRRKLDTTNCRNGRGSLKEFADDSTPKSSRDSNAKEIHSIMKKKSYNSIKKGLRAWSPSESENG
ncbi:pre-mRNA splicing factor, putative [Plasmodium knowlesi strain H]|uniref:Pre-mRNA splicing factor, putative n=2 Tax=Plasmodium knowlesi TaxID=5850 RepID=A0A679KZ55_PLAKH|nr:pre-mRNA splicing factor, putative [Plasmodium knowlesi strain H]OTN65734.1 putative Splicing factor [Plasmodium knowlesi]CAA9987957.1 pre-mRNA splicing factor, putative [Plasmodium knowlesi strain H]VVS77431.1 pre-mRNA splicing factor, putative [Plasmodium knowlesi strain H]